MSETVADHLLARLGTEWGVKRIYGYPGDGINGIMGAFGRSADCPEFIQVRHEEMAAFMACAHAKFTGEAGVCLATSGPGAIHLLESVVLQVNSELPQPEEAQRDAGEETRVDREAQADRRMTATFRAFADD